MVYLYCFLISCNLRGYQTCGAVQGKYTRICVNIATEGGLPTVGSQTTNPLIK